MKIIGKGSIRGGKPLLLALSGLILATAQAWAQIPISVRPNPVPSTFALAANTALNSVNPFTASRYFSPFAMAYNMRDTLVLTRAIESFLFAQRRIDTWMAQQAGRAAEVGQALAAEVLGGGAPSRGGGVSLQRPSLQGLGVSSIPGLGARAAADEKTKGGRPKTDLVTSSSDPTASPVDSQGRQRPIAAVLGRSVAEALQHIAGGPDYFFDLARRWNGATNHRPK